MLLLWLTPKAIIRFLYKGNLVNQRNKNAIKITQIQLEALITKYFSSVTNIINFSNNNF